MPATNIGLAIWRLKCFYETFVQGLTSVILLNFCAKFPPLRQAPKALAEIRAKLLRKSENISISKNILYFC